MKTEIVLIKKTQSVPHGPLFFVHTTLAHFFSKKHVFNNNIKTIVTFQVATFAVKKN